MELEIKDLKVGMTVLFTEIGVPRCYFKEYPIKLKITAISVDGKIWSNDFPCDLLNHEWRNTKSLCLSTVKTDNEKFESYEN